jgi:hypothetical protein
MFGHQDDQQAISQALDNQDNQWQTSQQDSTQQATQQSNDNTSQQGNDDTKQTETQESANTTALLEERNPDDLLDIKQQALNQLQPLVSHLDQGPEEKFRTLMMMIQASDDQSLIKSAFETATKISDEKQKAQALLDVVNEINYFTRPQNNN